MSENGFEAEVQWGCNIGKMSYSVSKVIHLPFMPVAGMDIAFSGLPLNIIAVTWQVESSSFTVDVEVPIKMYLGDSIRPATKQEYLAMFRDAGFEVEAFECSIDLEKAEKAAQKRRRTSRKRSSPRARRAQ